MIELTLPFVLSFQVIVSNYQIGIEIGLFRPLLLTSTNVPRCAALLKSMNFVSMGRT